MKSIDFTKLLENKIDFFNSNRDTADIGAVEYLPSLARSQFEDHKLTFYPNPIVGDFMYYKNDSSLKILEIYNSVGQLVTITAVDHGDGKIDLSKIIDGLYFVKTDTQSVKIIKNRQI